MKILLIEDCRADAALIRLALSESRSTFEFCWETSLAAALARLNAEEFGVVLLDLGLPDNTGLSSVAQIHAAHPELPIVVLTGSASDEMAMASLAHGAQDYLNKAHATCEVLTRSILYAIQRHQNIAIRQLLVQVRESQQELVAKNQQLATSEQRFRLMIEGVRDYAIFMLDTGGCVVNWNSGAQRIYGYTASEIIGQHFSIFCAADDVATGAANSSLATAAADGRAVEDCRRVRKDGSQFLANAVTTAVRNAQGEIIGYCRVTRDLTELKRAEEALRQREAYYRSILENAFEGVAILDEQGMIQYESSAAERILGYKADELIGKSAFEFVHPDDVPDALSRLLEVVQNPDQPLVTEFRLRHRDGSWRVVEICAMNQLAIDPVRGIVVNFRDVTEGKEADQALRKLDEQLRQAQKLEAVGELAGGVAHEFNNLLQAILGYTSFAMEDISPDDQRRQDLEQVVTAAQRATDLTRGLLSFSRRQPIKPQRVDLNAAVAELLKMLRPLIGEHVEVAVTLGEDVDSINADATLIQQMLMNLCLNARDAMHSGGKLMIKTENLVLSDSYCECHADVKPGHYVLISVADTGCGMSPEVKQHIFEPFFTTKDVGQGTGLGLAMVYGVIKQHRGAIHVYSELGHGTTIKVYLPVAHASSPEVQGGERTTRGGTETILIAEDEVMVRDLAVRILGEAGYQTLIAADGDEAIRVYEANADRIDLALLDVVMPKRFGRDVYQAIRMLNPTTKVIFCSGYEPDTNCEGFVTQEDLQLIQKPFDRDVLLRTVREVLDQEASCLVTELAT